MSSLNTRRCSHSASESIGSSGLSRVALLFGALLAGAAMTNAPAATLVEILESSTPADWRSLDPDNTLYLELIKGRVVIELAPAFAPKHADNIKKLVREHYFDGISIVRVQDNYVVQWGDPEGKRPIRTASRTLAAEFTRSMSPALPFALVSTVDGYAPEVGFSQGFPVARNVKAGRTWLAHCYGMVGAGRDNDADSGGGVELYVVIGHAPRHLDQNITLVGRVVKGMELLSSLPRGTGQMGFYETIAERVPIRSIRLAADVPLPERTALEIMRTDTPAFTQLIESRRNRREEWFKVVAGHVELCNVPIPVRAGK